MAKESLFNILANNFFFEELKSLDLFSGTGNISYELASRGSRDITAVDINGQCIRFIRETAEKLQFKGIRVVQQNALEFLSKAYHQYDLIFADPPYDYAEYEELIDRVFVRNLLSNGGMLVIEHSRRHDFSNNSYFYDHRKYGSVHFSFFKKTDEVSSDEKKTKNFFVSDNQSYNY